MLADIENTGVLSEEREVELQNIIKQVVEVEIQ